MSLQKERICAACNKSEPILDSDDALKTELKWCSRCKIVRYCSKTCQQSDFVTHKPICKKVSSLTKKVNIQFARLQNRESINNGPPEGGGRPGREGLRINLGSFNYDNLQQVPKEYFCAFEELAFFKYQVLKKIDSWESYQVTYHKTRLKILPVLTREHFTKSIGNPKRALISGVHRIF
jgi:hypothetical protein